MSKSTKRLDYSPPRQQSRTWLCTLSAEHYSREDIEKLLKRYDWIGQLERGKDGYLHWQIYIHNKSPIRFTTLRNLFPKGHFEVRKGTAQQALDYVTKDDTYAGVRIGNGEIDVTDRQGHRSDLEKYHELIFEWDWSAKDILSEYPSAMHLHNALFKLQSIRDERRSRNQRNVTVHYIFGKTGVGKTSSVLDRYTHEEHFRATDYKNPFDLYDSQPILILDEFDGEIRFNILLNLLDRYATEMPARYANKHAAFTEVWVLSNLPLESHYKEVQHESPDRWAALLRRFDTIQEMLPGGTLVDRHPNT